MLYFLYIAMTFLRQILHGTEIDILNNIPRDTSSELLKMSVQNTIFSTKDEAMKDRSYVMSAFFVIRSHIVSVTNRTSSLATNFG